MARELPPAPRVPHGTKVFHVSIRTRRIDLTGAAQVRDVDPQHAADALREALADPDLVRIEEAGEVEEFNVDK